MGNTSRIGIFEGTDSARTTYNARTGDPTTFDQQNIISTLDRLECARCGEALDCAPLRSLCPCGAPLLARYRLHDAAITLKVTGSGSGTGRSAGLEVTGTGGGTGRFPGNGPSPGPHQASGELEPVTGLRKMVPVTRRRNDMWRYAEVMPARGEPVSLGEGMTPLLPLSALAAELGLSQLLVKDEAVNPTGSFKARGMSAAVTCAVERGVTRAAAPSAGNAASALAAYGARAGMRVELYLPRDTPPAFLAEARLHGARLTLVDGTIADCARVMREEPGHEARFDFSTLREPYRIEGKKTMAYELWEQTGGALADVIVYPTGGGTGLIGMWKAFGEMSELGWPMPPRLPRMISVQSEGCAPIVRAFEEGKAVARAWEGAVTVASGLRVPSAIGDFLILRALHESGGCALAVSDAALVEDARLLARTAGILAAPEGGATLAALREARRRGLVREGERAVIFNTGTGLKYLEALG